MKCTGSFFAFLIVSSCLCYAQQASLAGKITDRFDGSPINGAQIVLSSRVVGISAADGSYFLTALQDDAELDLLYQKPGYGPRAEKVRTTKSAATKDVPLIKNTTYVDYWSSAAQSTLYRASAQPSTSAQQQTYTAAWGDIYNADISPEAKASAAHQLAAVMPNAISVPSTLSAYGNTSAAMISDTSVNFQQAIHGTGTIMPAVNSEVATDIAAHQVANYESTQQKQVAPAFFSDFDKAYGPGAGSRLRYKVQVDREIRGVNSHIM